MSNDSEDAIWTRAETRAGGDVPGAGDTALSNLLRVHKAVTDGGFARALEILSRDDLEDGAEGYEFFGALPLRDIVLEASDLDAEEDDEDGDEVEEPEDEVAEILDALDDRYNDIVVSDSYLADLVTAHYAEHPDDFAPVPA
ncbi:MAG: hypothetical protein JWP75_4129 [Frondihabitans sp.]|nr:hypothetical protein [Frondihabitans sp.]